MATCKSYDDNTPYCGGDIIKLHYTADTKEVTDAVNEVIAQLHRLQKAINDFSSGINIVIEDKDANS